MIFFNCDYNEGAHERILQRLMETNMEQTVGYGEDAYCQKAAELILQECQAPEADVHFLVGGTQANLTVIAAALRPYEGVLTADTGHINCHETGAVEATGHKVLALPGRNGKIRAEQVREAVRSHREDPSFEHIVKPGMVYISNPTEIGTIYHKGSLGKLYEACKECGLYLYIDGARLGYGLAARDNDLDLPFIARHCDVFTIGGTKMGTLFGEAVVITNPELQKDFRYMIKRQGGMLAKGRLLGIQFLAMFEDGLYYRLGEHADEQAMRIKHALIEAGCNFSFSSSTNQQFPVLSDAKLKKLSEIYAFSYWERVDEHYSMVRICTSWATKTEDVDALIRDIQNL
ncbi:MAG TPA: low specificity L-threonine aldolase [Candidatus Limivivens merdigallinarum]|uniref:Low specificity L-threonine aldolase n=1 Tax=Candidatus Limivivens merdigallinarum TaxID=2840859 RepID=A0A9D0ZVX4_9FIRM|nr:low specificity L-threonine aldolase [Candidatus Limivivens merdigallinarum]